jgi:hypothetical protein
MERGVHLVVPNGTEHTPTSVCIVRVSPRGRGTTMITVQVAADVEHATPGTSHSYVDAQDALAMVADFLRRAGATFGTPSPPG